MAVKLKVGVDTSEIPRGFGYALGVAKKFNKQLTVEAKANGDAQMRSLNEVNAAIARAIAKRTSFQQQWAQAQKSTTEEIKRLEKSAAEAALESDRKAFRERAKLLRDRLAQVSAAVREEQRLQLRGAAASVVGRGIVATGRFAARAASAGAGIISGAMADIQDAQQRRAQSEVGLGGVFRQAGFSVEEARQVRQQFEQAAIRLGIPLQALSEAAGRAQTDFSIFSGETQQERGAKVQEFLRNAELARNLGGTESITEFAQLGGLLNQVGGSENDRRATMLQMVRLSEMGAIEISQVVRESMGPLMAAVGQAQARLGPNATNEQRSAAGRSALVQTLAEMEVMRGSAGYTSRNAGNIFSALGNAVQNNRVQDRIRNNIMEAAGVSQSERNRIESALFEDDPNERGRRRLRQDLANDPLAFITAAGRAMQNNSTLFSNMFAGGGQGNPMALQANWRNLAARMFTIGADGKTGYERVQSYIEGSRSVDAADMERRRQLAEEDPMIRLTKLQEQRDSQLLDNTGALRSLAEELQAFRANNPLLAASVNRVGGEAGEIAAMKMQNSGDPGVRLANPFVTDPRARQAAANQFINDRQLREEAESASVEGMSTLQSLRYTFSGQRDRDIESVLQTSTLRTDKQEKGQLDAYQARMLEAVRQGLSTAQITVSPTVVEQTRARAAGESAGPGSTP